MLEEEVGYRFAFRHRFDAATCTWSGKEFAGLIPKRAVLPDAYHPERHEVVEFLGNYYHGFPVEHPLLQVLILPLKVVGARECHPESTCVTVTSHCPHVPQRCFTRSPCCAALSQALALCVLALNIAAPALLTLPICDESRVRPVSGRVSAATRTLSSAPGVAIVASVASVASGTPALPTPSDSWSRWTDND